jgi:glycosyltransferase involved in cell wall biosynthesis
MATLAPCKRPRAEPGAEPGGDGGGAVETLLDLRRAARPLPLDLDAGGVQVVSVVIPHHNCGELLREALRSVVAQRAPGTVHVWIAVHDDASADGGADAVAAVRETVAPALLGGCVEEAPGDDGGDAGSRACPCPVLVTRCTVTHAREGRGPGGARNACIATLAASWPPLPLSPPPVADETAADWDLRPDRASHVVCFLDCDDLMLPGRIAAQVRLVRARPTALVGGNFIRRPVNATVRYTDWANGLSERELWLDQFRECTLILPTWAMSMANVLRARCRAGWGFSLPF